MNTQLPRSAKLVFAIIILIVLYGLASIFWKLFDAQAAPALPEQVPYIKEITPLGTIVVVHPMVCQDETGVVSIYNGNTHQTANIGLVYTGCIAGQGVYVSNPGQLAARLGSGMMAVQECWIGAQEVYNNTGLFEFEAFQSWLPFVK